MKKWKCLVCGEIVESDVRPDQCPLCKAPGEKFVELKEEEGSERKMDFGDKMCAFLRIRYKVNSDYGG